MLKLVVEKLNDGLNGSIVKVDIGSSRSTPSMISNDLEKLSKKSFSKIEDYGDMMNMPDMDQDFDMEGF